MTAAQPTILATSGGYRSGERTQLAYAELVHQAVDLSGVHGRQPRVMPVGTACGDAESLTARLREQDVVWVWGGSVVNLPAVWRVHGLEQIMRTARQSGVVLGGISAGSTASASSITAPNSSKR